MLRALPLSLAAACAHASFEPRIEPVGDYRPTAELLEKARSLDAAALRKVRVSMGTLPPGVTLEEDLLVVHGDRYRLLADVSAEMDTDEAVLAGLGVWFWDYPRDARGKAAFCNAQVPLVWATLGLWMISPTRYPCFVAENGSPRSVDGRRDQILDQMVRATAAVGGDLLVVGGLGDLQLVDVWTGARVGGLQTVKGVGWAFDEVDPADPPQ